jgi:hypothetical protein
MYWKIMLRMVNCYLQWFAPPVVVVTHSLMMIKAPSEAMMLMMRWEDQQQFSIVKKTDQMR